MTKRVKKLEKIITHQRTRACFSLVYSLLISWPRDVFYRLQWRICYRIIVESWYDCCLITRGEITWRALNGKIVKIVQITTYAPLLRRKRPSRNISQIHSIPIYIFPFLKFKFKQFQIKRDIAEIWKSRTCTSLCS